MGWQKTAVWIITVLVILGLVLSYSAFLTNAPTP